MILASAKSEGISITGAVLRVWKTEFFSRLCLEEPFVREDPDCFFTVLLPVFFRGSGDIARNGTEVAGNSLSYRNFCDGFDETLFISGSGHLLKSGPLRWSIEVDFERLDVGTESLFRARRVEMSCSLLLNVQLV